MEASGRTGGPFVDDVGNTPARERGIVPHDAAATCRGGASRWPPVAQASRALSFSLFVLGIFCAGYARRREPKAMGKRRWRF
jgi:hypothetical protein